MKSENKGWLLVDDNEDVLLMLAAMAENLTDAKIECHPSPVAALAAFTAAPDRQRSFQGNGGAPRGLRCAAAQAVSPGGIAKRGRRSGLGN